MSKEPSPVCIAWVEKDGKVVIRFIDNGGRPDQHLESARKLSLCTIYNLFRLEAAASMKGSKEPLKKDIIKSEAKTFANKTLLALRKTAGRQELV